VLVMQFDVDNAWPSKVSGYSLNAENSSVVMEEMTIVHEGLIRSV
jgi:phage tail-like protein